MKSILLPGMALIAVCYAFARFAFGLFLPSISEEFRLDGASSGVIQSVSYAAYAIGLLSSSFMLRRAGLRRTLLSTALLTAAGLAGLALSPGSYGLAAALFAAGIGTGWVSPALGHLVDRTVQNEHKDAVNARINSGTSLGLMFSAPAAWLLAQNWRGAYASFAAIALLVALILWKTVPSDSGQHSGKTDLRREIRKSGGMIPAALLTGAGSAVYWTYFMSRLQAEQGVSDAAAALYWIVIGAAGIAGGCSSLASRAFGLRRSYVVGILCLAASIAAVPLPFTVSSLLSATLFGASYIFVTGLFIIWATRRSPAGAAQISLAFLALGIGQFVGSFLSGGLIKFAGYDAAFLIFGLIASAALTALPRSADER